MDDTTTAKNLLNHCDSKPFFLTQAEIIDGELQFDEDEGLEKALIDGFFLLKAPKDFIAAPGIKLCHNFYKPKTNDKDDAYKGFKKHKNIYFDREHFQTEHILTNHESRNMLFPVAAKKTADAMNELCIIILRHVLKHVGIPEKDWDLVTGGCLKNQGEHWLACSHYRSNLKKPGCAPHQDTGFVTVLYIDQNGLEAKLDDRWYPIAPKPGYFIINFGRSFEILTEHLPTTVKSILHRVAHIKPNPKQPDRISMAAFTNMPSTHNLYQYKNTSSEPYIYQSVKDFLEAFNRKTWHDQHKNFGL